MDVVVGCGRHSKDPHLHTVTVKLVFVHRFSRMNFASSPDPSFATVKCGTKGVASAHMGNTSSSCVCRLCSAWMGAPSTSVGGRKTCPPLPSFMKLSKPFR